MHTSHDPSRSKVTAAGSSSQTKPAQRCAPILIKINKVLSGKPRQYSGEESDHATTTGTGKSGDSSHQESTKFSEGEGRDPAGIFCHDSNGELSSPGNIKPGTDAKVALEASYSNVEFRDPILDTL